MPLIKCPMCGKDISPNAVACPHCGEPIKGSANLKQGYCSETEIPYNVIIEMCSSSKERVMVILRDEIGCTEKEAFKYVNVFPSIVNIKMTYIDAKNARDKLTAAGAEARIEVAKEEKKDSQVNSTKAITSSIPTLSTKIKCPNCGSTSTHKISTTGRLASGLTFGIFSSNIGKTWKCNTCGYKW